MAAVVNRGPWVTVLAIVAALFVIAAPRSAQAHGDQDHDRSSTRRHIDHPAASIGGTADRQSASPSSPCPAGSRSICGCHIHATLSRAGKVLPAVCNGWDVFSTGPA
ncbi:MAG: hypothetical protein ACT4P3_09015, partial [Betaproteobacteria bacterium]